MKPWLHFSGALWTLVVFCAQLKSTQATCVQNCTQNTKITTVSIESDQNCTLFIGNNSFETNVTGLTPGAVYQIFFGCFNCCKEITTKPEIVTNITASEITTSSLYLTWLKPQGNSSFYRVQWTDGSMNTTDPMINITNLTAGVQYNISVTAVADDRVTQGNSATKSLYTQPEVVRNLTVTDVTTSSVSVSWTEPLGNSSFYRVQWIGGEITDSVNVSESIRSITNLTAGVQYTITVSAVAQDGYTEGQTNTVYQYTKPEIVRNLSVTNVTTSSVSVSWTEPLGNSSFYRVQWIGGETKGLVNVSETFRSITNLTAGVQYNISVTAVADDRVTEGNSATQSLYTQPEVVRNLSVTDVTTSSVSVSWTEPLGNSSLYRVQWIGGETKGSVNVSETFRSITNLTAGVQYTITVSAVAQDGYTEGQSNTVYQYTKPEVVRHLTVTDVTTSSVSASWIEPLGNSSFYRVQWIGGETKGSVNVTETFRSVTNLTAGVQYTITVSAVAQDGYTEGQRNTVYQYTKPEVVRHLTVTDVTTSSVSVSWTEPLGNSSFYRVQWIGGETKGSVNVTETFRSITNLTAGVQYTITVSAVAQDGYTEGQTNTVYQYTKPEVVRHLTVTDVTTSSVSVNWTEPLGNSSFYRVQWIGGETKGSVNVTETFRSITNLTAGVQYTITVSAVAQDGYTEGQTNTVYQYTKPEVVRHLTVTNVTTSSVSVSWTEPLGNSSFYRVQWIGGETKGSVNVSETFRSITNLTAGVQYTITVSAVAQDGYTEGQTNTVYQYTKPEVVRHLTVTDVTTSSVSVNWTEPLGNSSFYRVQWIGGETKGSVNVTETFRSITNLTAGVQYTITVSAVAQDGYTEGQTNTVYQYTKPEVVRHLTVTDVTTSSVSVNWTEPLGNSSFYRVQWIGGETKGSVNVTETFRSITNLTAGVQYTITVSAVAQDGYTEGQTNTVYQYTKPKVVRHLTVTNVTTSSVSVSWTEPLGNSSFYRVQWIGGETKGSVNVSETFKSITNLTAGVQYTITVSAVAQDGYTEGQTNTVYQYTKPEVVRHLTVTDVTTSSVSASWTEPLGNSSFYRVQWIGGETKGSVNVTETFRSITNLTAGVQYTITVSAVAQDGYTEGQTNTVYQYTKPEVVRHLTVTNVTTSSVSVSWIEPLGNSSFYRVQWIGGETKGSVNVSETFKSITNLTAGVQYTITVSAVAQDGYTEGQTNTVYQYTKPEVVRHLTVTDVTTSSVSVSWIEPLGNSSFYRVQWIGGETKGSVNVSETFRSITNLTAGVQYTITVSAVAQDGYTEGQRNTVYQYTEPEVVRHLTVTDVTTSSVSASWTEPLGNSSFYRVQWIGGETKGSVNVTETFRSITNLTAGVQYTITVSAVAQDGYTEGQRNTVYQYTKPEVVRHLTVTDVTTSSVSVSWTEPLGNSSFYRVHWIGGETKGSVNVSETFKSITNLTAGVQYTITVSAVAQDGYTEGQRNTVYQYTKPEVVRHLTVTDVTTSSVSVNWTEPLGNSSFYRVQWIGGETKGSVNVTETFRSITNLTAGVQYTITVSAVAQDGYTEGQTNTVYQYTKPKVVRHLTVTNVTTSSVSVSWTEPLGNSSFYRVQWIGGETKGSVNVSETFKSITNLTAGVQYTITVSAVAQDGYTEGQSNTVYQYTKPEVVRHLTVTNVTTSSVSVSWTEPLGNSSFYRVQWIGGETKGSVNVSETFRSITNLTAGVQYTITVSAVAQDGYTEGQTNTVYQYTKPEVVRHLTVTDVTTSSVSAGWTEPLGNSSFYRVQWIGGETKGSVNVTETFRSITNLTAGVQYTITVSAVAQDGYTEGQRNTVYQYTKPEVVRHLTVTDVTTSSVSVSWTEPLGNSSFYRVQWIGGETKGSVNVSETFKSITNLTAGVQYTITVSAVAQDGYTEGQTNTVYQYTKPEVVRHLTVTNVTTSSVSVSWTEPLGNSSFYRVQWIGGETKGSVNVSETFRSITNLTAGVQYTITVSAVAQDGYTEGQTNTVYQYTRPAKVINYTMSTTTTSIALNWTQPLGQVFQYKVELYSSLPYYTTSTSANLSDLVPGTSYTVNITALAGDNKTEGETLKISAITKPAMIRNLKTFVTTTSVFLNWTKPDGNADWYKIQWNTTNVSTNETSFTITKLIPGSQYNITVAAAAVALSNEGEKSYITTFTKPEMPINITAKAETDSMNISWALPVGNVDHYVVNITNLDFINSIITKQNTAYFSSLYPGRLFVITVTAVAGNLMNSSLQSSFATYPTPPGPIIITQRTNSSLQLAWETPTRMKDAPNITYSITYQSSGAVIQSKVSTENSTELSQFQSGTCYNITVQTVGPQNLNSTAVYSSTYTLPNPVVKLVARPYSTTSVKVEWSDPVGSQGTYTYLVETYNATNVRVNSITVSSNNTEVQNLEPGSGYSFNVTTIAAPESQSSVEKTSSYTNPKAVTNLTVEYTNTTVIQLTWLRQSDYKPSYSYKVDAVAEGFVVRSNSTNNETFTFNQLVPGQQYMFKVVTVVANVMSKEESIWKYTSPDTVSLMAIGTTTSMFVSWTQAQGKVSSYSVLLYRDMQLVKNYTNLSNTTLSQSVEDLKPGVLYLVVVVTKSGPEQNNRSVLNATFPNPPGPISVGSQTVNSINFTWPLPKNMDYNQYNFSVSTNNSIIHRDTNWILLENLESGSPYTISVVTDGVLYESTAVTATKYTRPYAVTNLTQTEITTSAVTLMWTQPDSKPDYTYEVRVTNGSSSAVYNTTESSKNRTITDLSSGSGYNFTVTTLAADGTPAEQRTVNYSTRPYSVTGLEAETLNTSTIRLHWSKPFEYKAGYQYFVKTSGCGSQNKTVVEESIEISQLTAGTNCTFYVSVIAANGIKGEEKMTFQYTKPEIVRLISVSSQGSNSSILVMWEKPSGNVDYYTVYINATGQQLEVKLTNTSYKFENLSAGRPYNVRVTTFSGPFNASSESITNATFPNPPGLIEILMKTTRSVEFKWVEAPFMTGASFFYKLAYTQSQGNQSTTATTTNTSHVFPSLLSGTSYNISVTTVGALDFESAKVYFYMVTTRPESVQSLTASTNETNIDVSWEKPVDYKQTYRYNFTWQPAEGGSCDSTIVNGIQYKINDLNPGSQYNFSVTTETSDGTQGAPIWSSSCTNASPVPKLECYGPNSEVAQLIINWTKPSGQYSSFQINSSNGVTNISKCCTYTVKTNLTHYTQYNLTMETQSCGRPSTPVPVNCRTGITNPVIPPFATFQSLKEKTQNTFSIQIDLMQFDNSKGPIQYVGVLVANGDFANSSNLGMYLGNTYGDWTKQKAPVYLATVRRTTFTRSSDMVIIIGDDSTWEGYSNGALNPGNKYRYATVLLPLLVLDGRGHVNSTESLYSITNLSVEIVLPNDQAVIAIAVGTVAGIFSFLFFVLIGFIIYWKRLANKAPSDIQIHSMRAKVSMAVRAEDYEAFYNKQKADSNCGFAEEFEDLKIVGTGQAKIHALSPENKPKNRYNNVLPWVQLQEGVHCSSGSFARHGQRVLEDDLGEECADSGHAYTL
ncbi:tenascin-X isoform X3 [Parambassis ranga]|uniref:protein-tyrosine-phosphatase n=1 Tax=Parambassis ranga TaxID=210632 RepID=A0A6P7ICT6_9TELE|nr:tenascin-X-like isoform X3 [Parambassis ranga]